MIQNAAYRNCARPRTAQKTLVGKAGRTRATVSDSESAGGLRIDVNPGQRAAKRKVARACHSAAERDAIDRAGSAY